MIRKNVKICRTHIDFGINSVAVLDDAIGFVPPPPSPTTNHPTRVRWRNDDNEGTALWTIKSTHLLRGPSFTPCVNTRRHNTLLALVPNDVLQRFFATTAHTTCMFMYSWISFYPTTHAYTSQ